MEEYLKFKSGEKTNDLPSVSECSDKKKAFYECVITQKNELTKTMNEKDWPSYKYKVHEIGLNCYKEGSMKSCDKYFSFYDINY